MICRSRGAGSRIAGTPHRHSSKSSPPTPTPDIAGRGAQRDEPLASCCERHPVGFTGRPAGHYQAAKGAERQRARRALVGYCVP
jgi:hypothetical protein